MDPATAPEKLTRSGFLLAPYDPAVTLAYRVLLNALRERRHTDILCRSLEVLEASMDRAFLSPEGIRYLEGRPTLKQRVVARLEKSGRTLPVDSCSPPAL